MKKIEYLFLCSLFVVCSCNKISDFDMAVVFQNDGKYEKAIKYYGFAIKKGKQVATAERNLADIYFFKGEYRKAFEHYKNSLETDVDVALDKVMQFISYGDENVRKNAYKVISEIKSDKTKNKIFAYLSKILRSDDRYKILDVLELLSNFNSFAPIADDVIILLNRDDLIIKQKVLPLLPHIPAMIVVEKGYIDKVMSFLNQDNRILKEISIDTLGNMDGWSKKAVPALVRIAVEQPTYRDKALHAIEKIGLPDKEQVVEIFNYIKDRSVETRVKVLEMFGSKGAGVKDFIPNLILFLDDKSEEVRRTVRRVLSRVGKANISCVPDLINLLQSKNEEIVSRAIYELGDLGEESLKAVTLLKRISEDETKKKDLRILAKEALQKIQK